MSGFCAPDVAEADRPWSRNGPMSDEEFKEECRGSPEPTRTRTRTLTLTLSLTLTLTRSAEAGT